MPIRVLTVDDREMAAAIGDQSRLLEGARDDGDSRRPSIMATNSYVSGKLFLPMRSWALTTTVQSLLDSVNGIARGSRHGEADERLRITSEQVVAG
jgi:hypothetical protein